MDGELTGAGQPRAAGTASRLRHSGGFSAGWHGDDDCWARGDGRGCRRRQAWRWMRGLAAGQEPADTEIDLTQTERDRPTRSAGWLPRTLAQPPQARPVREPFAPRAGPS